MLLAFSLLRAVLLCVFLIVLNVARMACFDKCFYVWLVSVRYVSVNVSVDACFPRGLGFPFSLGNSCKQ